MGEVHSLVTAFNKAKHAPRKYYPPLPTYGTTLPNLKQHKTLSNLLEIKQEIRHLCLLKDGRLIMGFEYGILMIYNLSTYQIVFQFQALDKETLTNICLFDDDRVIITSSKGTLSMWSIYTNSYNKICEMKAHKQYIYSITKLSRQRIATCSSDRTIKIFSSEIPFKCIITLKGHIHEVTKILHLKNTEVLLSASIGNDSTIRIWNMVTYKCDTIIKQATMGYKTDMIEAPDKKIVIGGGGIVSVLQYKNMKFEFLMRYEHDGLSKVFGFTVLSNGLVLGRASNGVLTVIDTTNKTVRCITDYLDLYLIALLDVASDTFVSGDRDGQLIIWKY